MDQVVNPLRHLQRHLEFEPESAIKETPEATWENWRDYAECKGRTEVMFPQYHKDITYIAAARAICKSCPVRDFCLDDVLTYPMADISGVWAGMTPRQLAAEQRRRGIRPSKPTLAAIWSDLHRN